MPTDVRTFDSAHLLNGVNIGSASTDHPLLPRVVVVYDAMSTTPMRLAEAAKDICRLIWVVDGTDAVMAPLMRLLRGLGEVIDSAGLDVDSIASKLTPHAPSGICTLSDAQMPLTATLSEQLSLVYHSVSTTKRLTDKYLQRRALHYAGLPTPQVWKVPNPRLPMDDYERKLQALIANVTFPVVVKPRRGTNSCATARANDSNELSTLLATIGDQAGGLLIEKYLADRVTVGPFADDLAVELVLQKGRVSHLATTGKFRHAPPFRGRGCFLPSHVDPSTETALFETAEAAVLALGITDGFANVDIKLTPEGPRIVEVNGRIGGNVPELIELAGGPAILSLVFRLALGDDLMADPAFVHILDGSWARVGYFAWVQSPMSATHLVGTVGLEEVAKFSHVTRVVRNRNPGDSLDWVMGGRTNVCTVFGSVEHYADLAAARDEIDDKISLEWSERNDGGEAP